MNDFRDEAQGLTVVRLLAGLLEQPSNDLDGTLGEVTWLLWRATGEAGLDDLVRLPPAHLTAIGSLLVALGNGPEDVDEWVAMYETVQS